MGTLLLLATACNSGSSEEKTVNVRLSECLRATLEPGQYMACAEEGGLPPRPELKACLSWLSTEGAEYVSLRLREGWIPSDDGMLADFRPDDVTEIAFFLGGPDLSCGEVTPQETCLETRGCIVKLQGRVSLSGNTQQILFRDEEGQCMADLRAPDEFLACVDCQPEGSCESSECGNGTVDDGEACDDGNRVTEVCEIGVSECVVCAADCTEQPGAIDLCGIGEVDYGETCDDGYRLSDDCEYGPRGCTVRC